MSLVRSARFAIQSFRQLLAASRRWLPFTAILLVVVCVGLIQRSAAIIQNPQTATIVSAASNEPDALAAESLATAYGVKLATQSDIAVTPQPQLAGTTVEVAGRTASLLFVSPEQVNFLIPAGVPPGLATVTVRAGDGAISTGTTNINAAAPALFTAGGVVSGFALRVNASGAQSYEPVAEFDTANGQFKTKAIDLNSAAGDQVFLVFFLSGLRNADPAQVRVILGGDEFAPVFAGAVPGAPGLDQINLPLSRELAGKGVLNLVVRVPNARPSNPARIEIGGGVSTLAVNPLSKQTVVAGETLEIEGTNLPTSNVEVLFEPNVGVAPETLTPTKMTLRVPFGVATGAVKISVNKQIAYVSPQPLNVITSVSGFVQEFKDNARVAIAGLPVVMVESSGRRLETVTNSAGAFLIRDAAQSSRSTIQIKGQAANGLGYEVPPFGIRVEANRDNQASQEDTTPRVVELKPNGSVTTSLTVADTPINETLRVTAGSLALGSPNEAAGIITAGQVSFDTNNSMITCPGGASGCQLALNVFDPGRTPTNLPAGVFSSTIAQITPFGATLTPGGKITFPNSDANSAATPLRVYRYDQTPASATFGQFVDVGPGIISSDGQRLETEANAVTQASYYLISRQWRLMATIIGHVVEADGVRPVRRAVVSARGQSTFTDGNGGFVLRNIPVIKANDTVTLEVSSHRADGTVSRTERTGVAISTNAQVTLPTDISLPQTPANLGPTILAPAALSLIEGETREFNFLVTGLAGAQPTLVDRPLSASLRSLGNEAFALRLVAPQSSAGNYQVTLEATAQNKTSRQTIAVTVVAANANTPLAKSDALVTDEDTPVNITLASANVSNSPVYTLTAMPLHGSLNGMLPNVRYTPAPNYNGIDSFSFKVRSGNVESSAAAVVVIVRPVNDVPVLIVPDPQVIRAGEPLKVLISATDVDNDQALNFIATGLPQGASLVDARFGGRELSWTPAYLQEGTFVVNLRVEDNGLPPLSDVKPFVITVRASWAQTSGPEGNIALSMVSLDGNIYAGTGGGGVFRSTDNGESWAAVNKGLSGNALVVRSLVQVGTSIYAGTEDGVYLTNNNGQSWTVANKGLFGAAKRVFDLLPIGVSIYAGTYGGGVYRTTDNGQNWTAVNNGLSGGGLYVSSLLSLGSSVYVGTQTGVYRTTDNGQSWIAVINGLTGEALDVLSLLAIGNTIYAGTFGGGVYRTINNGQNWVAINNGLLSGPPDAFGDPALDVNSLIVAGSSIFAGTQSGIFLTTNSGQNWITVNNGLLDGAFNVRSLMVAGGNIFAGTFEGIYRTGNLGQEWERKDTGVTASQVYALASAGGRLLTGTGEGAFSSINSGASWIQANQGLDDLVDVNSLATTNNNIFAGTLGNGIYRSTDNGQTWKAVNSGLSHAAFFVYSLLPVGDNLFAGSFGGVYRTTDYGQNWMAVNNSSQLLNSGEVTSLIAVGSSIFAGTGYGGVFRTTDNGQSWSAINTGLSGKALTVFSLMAIGNSIFAGTNAGIYRTTNNGLSWTAVNSGLSGNALSVFSLLAVGNNIFAGTYGGVYRSSNSGLSWVSASSGLSGNALVSNAFLLIGSNILVGTFDGVYRTTDNGQNWTAVNNGLTGRADRVFSLLTAGTSIFAGAMDGGVSRSTDNAQTWMPVNKGLPSRSLRINTYLTKDNSIFAGTWFGVYRSTDGGQRWAAVNNGLSAISISIDSLQIVGNSIWAGTQGGIYRTADDGQNWVLVSSFLSGNTLRAESLAAAGNSIYAGTQLGGVYRSTDNGISWVALNNGLSGGGLSVYSFLVMGGNIFAGTYGGVYRLNASGSGWIAINGGLSEAALRVRSLLVMGSHIFAGTEGGIYRSIDNGQNWTLFGNGLTNVAIYSLATHEGKLFAGTAGNGVSIISDAVQSWAESNTNLVDRSINAVIVNGNYYFAGSLSHGVFRSADEGRSWSLASDGLPPSANVQSLAASGASLFAGTFGQGIYRSINNGNGWTEFNNGLPINTAEPANSPRRVNALRFSGATLLAATDGGVFRFENFLLGGNWAATGLTKRTQALLVDGTTVYAGTLDDGVYRSTDRGQTWQRVNQGLGNLDVRVLGLSGDGASLYAGTTAGLYRSTDRGGSWTLVTRDLPPNLVVSAFATNGAKLFIGTVYGIFLSTDNGTSWIQINAGLLDIYVASLVVSGDKLIAGTKAGGVFVSRLNDAFVCVGISQQPASKTINRSQTATLTINPVGDQPIEYQWYQGASGDLARPITGANGSSYTTPPLDSTTNYWVQVKNSCGIVSSDTASVLINSTPQADLAIMQTIAPAQPRPGDNLTFTFILTNRGGEKALAVNVTNPLPVEIEFTACGATGGGVCGGAGNNRTVFFSEMAGYASATVTLTAKVKADAGGKTLRNNASVSAATNDTNLSNNSDPKSVTVQQTAPMISSLNPSTAVVGGAGFTLMVNGSNFVSGAKVRWNGGERQTSFVSATQLTAQIPASDLTAVGIATVTVANPDGQFSGVVQFAVTLPPRQNSILRVVAASGSVGGTVAVPIELFSQGDENALGFSLTFDPAILSNPQVALGNGASGAALNPNLSQAAAGRVGLVLAMPSGQRFAAGVRQIAVITFIIAANTSAATASLEFGNQPIPREVSDVNANELGATYTGGAVTITRGFEADVAPRPNGNGSLSVTDWVLVGRFASGDLAVEPGSEFQRTDCAPRSTFGNGSITVSDWVQAGRYAAGLDPLTPAAGPTSAGALAAANLAALLKVQDSGWPRLLRVSSPVFGAGQTSAVTVELLAQGEENAVSFSLRFDARQWRFVSASVGEDARNAVLSVNTKLMADGQVGFALAMPPGQRFEAGMQSVLTVNFAAVEGGGTFAPTPEFSDWPTSRELANVKAEVLTADWMPAALSLFTLPSSAAGEQGLAAGVVIRVGADGRQRFESLAVVDSRKNGFVAVPIEVGDENEQVFLALFGTGWQNGEALDAIQVTVGGLSVEVLYAGAQGGEEGMAQLNLRLPPALKGRGEVIVQFINAGRSANPVKVVIK